VDADALVAPSEHRRLRFAVVGRQRQHAPDVRVEAAGLQWGGGCVCVVCVWGGGVFSVMLPQA
jgi:hypothetical protein